MEGHDPFEAKRYQSFPDTNQVGLMAKPKKCYSSVPKHELNHILDPSRSLCVTQKFQEEDLAYRLATPGCGYQKITCERQKS